MSCQHLRMNDLEKASREKKGNGDSEEKNVYISNVFRDIGEVLNNT